MTHIDCRVDIQPMLESLPVSIVEWFGAFSPDGKLTAVFSNRAHAVDYCVYRGGSWDTAWTVKQTSIIHGAV